MSFKKAYSSNRLIALDWLRIIGTQYVIFYHVVRFADLLPHNVKISDQILDKNPEREVFEIITRFLSYFMMPMFFMIAGFALGQSLKSRQDSLVAALRERTLKLLVPFLACLVLVVAPSTLVIEKPSEVQSLRELLGFAWEVLSQPRRSWRLHHSWFLIMLYGITILELPFFVWIRSCFASQPTEKPRTALLGIYGVLAAGTGLFAILVFQRFCSVNSFMDVVCLFSLNRAITGACAFLTSKGWRRRCTRSSRVAMVSALIAHILVHLIVFYRWDTKFFSVWDVYGNEFWHAIGLCVFWSHSFFSFGYLLCIFWKYALRPQYDTYGLLDMPVSSPSSPDSDQEQTTDFSAPTVTWKYWKSLVVVIALILLPFIFVPGESRWFRLSEDNAKNGQPRILGDGFVNVGYILHVNIFHATRDQLRSWILTLLIWFVAVKWIRTDEPSDQEGLLLPASWFKWLAAHSHLYYLFHWLPQFIIVLKLKEYRSTFEYYFGSSTHMFYWSQVLIIFVLGQVLTTCAVILVTRVGFARPFFCVLFGLKKI